MLIYWRETILIFCVLISPPLVTTPTPTPNRVQVDEALRVLEQAKSLGSQH